MWSVNYVCEIFHSSISDMISTWVRRINRATALYCSVGLTYGAAILRLENEARHGNFEIALFQSVTKYIQHPLKCQPNSSIGSRIFHLEGNDPPQFFPLPKKNVPPSFSQIGWHVPPRPWNFYKINMEKQSFLE